MAEGQQQQQQAPSAADARAFVTSFVPDPKILEGMKDDQVLAYHGSVSKALEGHVAKANEARDWRKEIADDDVDLKTLGRFASPKALWQQNKEFTTKLSKGEMRLVKEFPEKGTDEEKAAWRQQNNVPVDGKYDVKLPQGLELTEADQPLVEGFTKFAHEQNMPASEVNKSAAWFFGERAKRQEESAAAFETAKRETAAELGKEWGADYKGINNRIAGVLDASIPSDEAGVELKGTIQRAIETNPMFARMWAKIALEMNPAGTLIPGDKGANEATITDEIKKIEAARGKDRRAYDKDEAMQSRYRELLGAYQKTAGKEWGR